jgi:hypothetical protein
MDAFSRMKTEFLELIEGPDTEERDIKKKERFSV